MGFSAPSARILAGVVVLALALFTLVWDKSLLREGIDLHVAVGPLAAWAVFALLGLAMLADGFFRRFNKT
jgi:hypothetical protein